MPASSDALSACVKRLPGVEHPDAIGRNEVVGNDETVVTTAHVLDPVAAGVAQAHDPSSGAAVNRRAVAERQAGINPVEVADPVRGEPPAPCRFRCGRWWSGRACGRLFDSGLRRTTMAPVIISL